MQRIAVIGLGRFGSVLARNLGKSGAQVIGVDNSKVLVADLADEIDRVVCLDSTDRHALTSQEIHDVDVAVVAIGEAFEAALLTTALLRQLGVPKVIARAQTAVHAEILERIGAHEVIQPEVEAGTHLARRLANPQIEDFVTLSAGFAIIEIRTPAEFIGKAIAELNLRAKYDVNIVAIKPVHVTPADGEEIVVEESIRVPRPTDVLTENDVLVVVGSQDALGKLPRK